MGSGKSTIGPILANVLGYDFVDIDRAIEKAVGKTIGDIFLESGEDHFRTIERHLIAGLQGRDHCVISLGGGTMIDEQNLGVITSSGIVVYLKSSPENIFKRIYHREDRPVLKDLTGERLTDDLLRERIQRLYFHREPIYATADFTIVTDDKRVGITVDEIVRTLSPHLNS